MTTTSPSNYTTLYNPNAGLIRPQQPYGNANVVSLLKAGTDGGNTISNIIATGNVTASNFIGNVVGNVTGNITGNVVGNLTGNVNGNVTGNITGTTGVFSGNVTADNFIGNLSGNINGNVVANNITITGNLSGTTAGFSGNVTAPFFLGNVVGNISGNIVVPGVQGSVLFNDGGNAGADTGFVYDKTLNTLGVLDGVTSAVFTGNLSGTTSTVTGNSNAALFNGNLSGNYITVTGNANAATFNGNLVGSVSAGNISANGNIDFSGANVSLGAVGNLHITGGSAAQVLTTDGSGGLSWTTISVGTANIIANVNSNVSIPTANGNVYVNANAGTDRQWVFDTTGNLVVPGNSVISSVSNNLTLEGNAIFNNLRVNGISDTGGLPSTQQTGWLFNNNWQRSSGQYNTTTYASPFTNTGSFTSNPTFYLYTVTPNGSGATLGSPTISVDTTSLTAGIGGGTTPLTWDTGNTTPMIGQGIAIYDSTVSSSFPSGTIFPAGTTIQSINVGAGTITMSANAIKTAAASTFTVQSGTMMSYPAYNFYMLVGDSAAVPTGKIQSYSPPIIPASNATNFGLSGWGGPFLNDTPAGNTFTYSPAQTWITYPEFRDGTSPGGYRAIDMNNVPGTIMSFSRYNNPIMIGADNTGNAAGFPTITGRSDSTTYNNGFTLLKTGLDTRRNSETNFANPQGTLPSTSINLITYDTAQSTGTAAAQRQAREKTGPLISNFVGNGNINTDNANIYAKQYQGGGSVRFNMWSGSSGINDFNPNILNSQAGIYSRAEANLNNSFTVTGASGTGTTATLTFATQPTIPYNVGQQLTVTGVTPAGYNGVYSVTACTTNSVSYASTETGAFVSGGNCVTGAVLAPVGLYLQYTPSTLSTGNARTFLRALNQDTTLSGGTNIYLKPLPNMSSSAGSLRRELDGPQDQIWVQASSYSGGNATTEGTGTLVQVRSDRASAVGQGNVALGINRTQGTAASYELIIKSGESALTLYDKNNTANIATFTNTASTFNGNLTAANIVTNSGSITGNSNIAVTGTITNYNKTWASLNYGTTINGLTPNTVYAFTLAVVSGNNITMNSGSRITIAKAGTYNIQISVQLENLDVGNDHEFTVWFAKNGTDITYSATEYTVVKGHNPGGVSGKNVAALNFVDTCNANDYYEIRYAVDDANIVMPYVIAQTSPYVRPQIPPVIVTVVPVGA